MVVSADDGTFAVDDTFDVTINPVNDAPVLVNLPALSSLRKMTASHSSSIRWSRM
ncbi:MAG: hypothetical protein R3C26_01350 [Calditrichia bacterium]